MIPHDSVAQGRHLQKIEASVLTEMLVRLGQVQAALQEKGFGSTKIENIAILAVEHGRTKAPQFMENRPSLAKVNEWDELQWDAVDEAEAKFAGVINYIVELRDGSVKGEED